jgi:hypothetical protein
MVMVTWSIDSRLASRVSRRWFVERILSLNFESEDQNTMEILRTEDTERTKERRVR